VWRESLKPRLASVRAGDGPSEVRNQHLPSRLQTGTRYSNVLTVCINSKWGILVYVYVYRVFKKELYNFVSLYKFIQRTLSVLNCHNITKHTEFYLGWLRFNVTSIGNAGINDP
jgi:hypothetical protein